MNWNLVEVRKETKHRFLNFYTLVYDVKEGNEHRRYEYYMTSRKEKENLLPVLRKTERPDGVMIPLYYVSEEGKVYFLLTRQFRPALGLYVTSVPAGLMEKEDTDILAVARREAKEEAGVEITDLEVLAEIGSTSSGFSDETNGIVLGRIVSKGKKQLEEFEDISSNLYSIPEVESMLKDKGRFFALEVRTLLLYLLLRFKDRR